MHNQVGVLHTLLGVRTLVILQRRHY